MKRIILLSLMIVLAMTTKAQDTIVFRNGDIKTVKVTEVSDTQIKYYLWDNQDGPVYIKNVQDIFVVKYKNGGKDLFDQNQTARQPQTQKNEQPKFYGRLTRENGTLFLDGNKMNEIGIQSVLGSDRYETFYSAKSQYNGGKLCLFLGFMSLLGGVTCLISDLDDYSLTGYCLLGLADVFLPVGFTLNGIGKGRMNWVVDDYNRNGSQLSQNFSVSVSPSLVCVPTATGNSYSLGAGIQLHF